jgi:E3 ubiquitin-protein ligase listerin
MNPFETNKIFNSEIYECINKINKNSDKNIIQGLTKLIEIEDESVSSDNIMLRDALKKHILSSNNNIKHLASELLYKLLETESDHSKLHKILSCWFIKFVEDHSYVTDKLIYKKYIKLEFLEDDILTNLDWENDLLTSMKCFSFLIKRLNIKNKETYQKYFEKKITYLRYNSNIILKHLYIIMENLGTYEEVYDSVLSIIAPTLINSKWLIIYKLFHKIPPCINQDGKYLDSDFLKIILLDYQGNVDDIEIRNLEGLYVVTEKTNKKLEYFKRYLSKIKLEDLCIYRLSSSIKEFDQKFGFTFVNQLIENTIRYHNLFNLTNNEYKDLINNIKQNNLDTLIKLKSMSEYQKNEQTPSNKNCCKLAKVEIFYDLISSINYLESKQQIIRGDLLNIELNKNSFNFDEIMEVLPHSVNVFEKEIFLYGKVEGVDIAPIICKYSDHFSSSDVSPHLRMSNIVDIGKNLKFKDIVLEFLTRINLKEFCENHKLPKEYDLFLFYNLGDYDVRYIDYDELIKKYFSCEFIELCYNLEIFNRDLFNKAIIDLLSEIEIPVTTEYNDPFYDTILHFYENIKVRKDVKLIREIKNIYSKHLVSDMDRLILSVCNTILNDGATYSLSCHLLIDLKKNNYYLYKVYNDLGWSIQEPFDRNNEIDALINEEKDIKKIDIDDENHKVVDLKITRGFLLDTINISYVSNKSLKIYIDYIKKEEDIFKFLDLIENDEILKDADLKSERYKIYEPILDSIYNYFSDAFINNFSLSQAEDMIDENELYDFLISGMPRRHDLFWKILPTVLMKIRNLNLMFFIEKIINKTKDFKMIYDSVSKDIQEMLAFLFPSLYVKYIKVNIDLNKLISKEAEYAISEVECRYSTRSTGTLMNLKYIIDGNDFDYSIRIPSDYPLKKPDFTTNVEKKSLLNLKISEMLRRTSKFMEVINIWKINIDQKSMGVQECYICYFILHLMDGSFPKYVCIHCSNKFHNKCIDKWRSGYKKNNCPLCRKPLPIY